MKKRLMEFLGTFFLVFTVASTGNPFAIAAMLIAWMYIGFHVSGAHYNPVVSCAVALRGLVSWTCAAWFIGAQLLGSIAAYFLTYFFYGQIIVPVPTEGVTLINAALVEFLISFVFAWVVLTVATMRSYREHKIFGFVIGLTVLALIGIGAPISGGLFNPAIAVGAHVAGMALGLPVMIEHSVAYIFAALLGGVVAERAFAFFAPAQEL